MSSRRRDTISKLARQLQPHLTTKNSGDASSGGVTNHGNLSGLLDDDHPQYVNIPRGDARYLKRSESITLLEHDIIGEKHTVSGSAGQIVGLTATNTLGLIAAGTGIDITGATISGAYTAGLGIDITGATISHALTGGNGIDITGADVSVDLDANPGLTVGAGGLVMGTPSTLTYATSNGVSGSGHTHSITTTSDGDANKQSILRTNPNGRVTVTQLEVVGYSEQDQIRARSDSAAALILTDAAGNAIVTLDTSNDEVDVTGALNVSETLDVTGATTLSSTLGVTGATNLDGTLTVTGVSYLDSNTYIRGANLYFDNNRSIYFDDQLGTPVQVLRMNGTDNLSLGDTTGFDDTYINAARDIILQTGTGDIETAEKLRSPGFISKTTGAQIDWADGEGTADFRSIYADAMIVQTFIADVTRAQVGSVHVSKSMSRLSRDFTIPAPGGSTTLYVEDIPGHGNMAAFDDSGSGDWALVKASNTDGGGYTLYECWGRVTGYSSLGLNADTGLYEQSYTFAASSSNTSFSGTITARTGDPVIDFGRDGDGYVYTTTLDNAGAPYIQVATIDADPSDGGDTVHLRLGNLDGIGVRSVGSTWGLYVDEDPNDSDAAWIEAGDAGMGLHNVPVNVYHSGGNDFAQLTSAGLSVYDTDGTTLQVRAGGLSGITEATGNYGLFVAGGDGFIEISDTSQEVHDVPINMHNAGSPFLEIGPGEGIIIYDPGSDYDIKTSLAWMNTAGTQEMARLSATTGDRGEQDETRMYVSTKLGSDAQPVNQHATVRLEAIGNTTSGDADIIMLATGQDGTGYVAVESSGGGTVIDLLADTIDVTGPATISSSLTVSGNIVSPTINGDLTIDSTAVIKPDADATDAIEFANVAGTTTILKVDTTNDRLVMASSNIIKVAGSHALIMGRSVNSTGNYGTAIGPQAAYNNTSDYVSAVGYRAGYNNAASYVDVYGYQAGYGNSGTNVAAFGRSAGQNNTANVIIAVGRNALMNNTGTFSAALGYMTGYDNSGGYFTGVGSYAGQDNSGDYVSALGYLALDANTQDDTTAVGAYAGRNNTGQDATFIGHSVGSGNSTNYRVAIGNVNGVLLDGIMQGFPSSDSLTINTWNLIIGRRIKPDADASNGIEITNVAGTAIATFDTIDDRVGIGEATTPRATLHASTAGTAAPTGIDTGVDIAVFTDNAGDAAISVVSDSSYSSYLKLGDENNISAMYLRGEHSTDQLLLYAPNAVLIGDASVSAYGSETHQVSYRDGGGHAVFSVENFTTLQTLIADGSDDVKHRVWGDFVADDGTNSIAGTFEQTVNSSTAYLISGGSTEVVFGVASNGSFYVDQQQTSVPINVTLYAIWR